MAVKLRDIAEALKQFKLDETLSLTQAALAEGQNAAEILQDGLISGMREVGATDDFFLPEVMMAAKIFQTAFAQLDPLLKQSGYQPKAKVLVCTVAGDVHDIGKSIVGAMLNGAGYEVIDLGYDVAADRITKAMEENQAQAVCMSTLLTTTMLRMPENIAALKNAGFEKTVVMVGGAPVSREWALSIGANGYADDAPGAVTELDRLLAEK